MPNEQNKTTRVRFVAAPSRSSKPTKTTIISAAVPHEEKPLEQRPSVVCVIGDSCATCAIDTLLDSLNG
jgi:hypothetical protein